MPALSCTLPYALNHPALPSEAPAPSQYSKLVPYALARLPSLLNSPVTSQLAIRFTNERGAWIRLISHGRILDLYNAIAVSTSAPNVHGHVIIKK